MAITKIVTNQFPCKIFLKNPPKPLFALMWHLILFNLIFLELVNIDSANL